MNDRSSGCAGLRRACRERLQRVVSGSSYNVDSIVADPGAYTKEQLATLHSQIVSNLERAWELLGGSEDQLTGTMMQGKELGRYKMFLVRPVAGCAPAT